MPDRLHGVGEQLGRRLAGPARIWLLTAILGGLALALYLTSIQQLRAPEAPLSVPWWVLAAFFFLAQAFGIHLHFRRDALSFTLVELPLVFALFFASPSTLVQARLVGAALALALVRRQRPVKLGFNLSLAMLETSLAALIFHQLAPIAEPLVPRGQIGAFLAIAAATVTSGIFLFVAMSVGLKSARLRELPRSLCLGVVIAMANTSLALIGVASLWRDPAMAWLLLIPTGVLLLAYRAYLRERKKHESLEFLYETARVLHRSAELGEAMRALLEQARKIFRADVAEIVLLPSNGEAALRTTLGPGEHVEVLTPVDRAFLENGALSAVSHGEPVLLGRPTRSKGLATNLRAGQVKDAMIAPLRGDERTVGTLLVGDRLGDLSTFDKDDFQLFETLAKHAGLSLELIELDEQLRHQAFHDSLTGLPNWALFRDRLDERLAQSEGKRGAASVLVFDLDDFKTINDSLGHAAGDQLLVAAGERLRRLVGPNRPAARLGGDEFAVLVGGPCDEAELVELAERILEKLREPFMLRGKEVATTASLGIATATGQEDAGELLRNADAAMHKSKARGRGNLEIFEASMHTAALQRLELKGDLEAALKHGELSLRYQPIVALHDGRIKGFEALVRWRHPQRGPIGPDEFIPLAEETGLIVPIGQWVLEEACRQAAEWQAQNPGQPALTVGVNLSPVQLRRPRLVDEVARALRGAKIDPGSVVLEITESVFLDDAELMIERLKALKELGVQIALDDFGTGYSSLGYLGRLPIDILKIAKPFVDKIGLASEDSALAEAIVRMSEALGLTTLAEGIEDAGQREYLTGLGCELGQGYFFAKPLDADGMESLLHFRDTGLQDPPAQLVRLRPALRRVG